MIYVVVEASVASVCVNGRGLCIGTD